MQQYAEPVTDLKGNAIPGAQVTIRNLDGTLAALFQSDGVTALDNPVATDARGFVTFKAANGNYTRSVMVASQSFAVPGQIVIDTPASYVTMAQLGASSGAGLVWSMPEGVGAVAVDLAQLMREGAITPQRFMSDSVRADVHSRNGTLNCSSAIAAMRAHINTIPLSSRPVPVIMPPGLYVCDGLAFDRPVSLYAHGATLSYTGVGKAVKLGPDGIANFDAFLQGEYTVDGLRLTGGANATHGIYVNDYVLEPRIRNLTFEDFGNANSVDIFSQFEVWDILIENCRKLTYSSVTATGNFIAITGRNKANTADDGGNSRATIRDCWMTSYSGQELGFFAYINAVKSRIVGGGFQHSRGGIKIAGNAGHALIDNVYAELSTATGATYITALSNDAGGGKFSSPQGIIIRGGYVNMHQEIIGSAGRIIRVGDANVKLAGWKIDGCGVGNYASGQVLIEQNDIDGQAGNSYAGVRRYYSPAILDDGKRFVLRGAYINSERWASFDAELGAWVPTLGGTATYAIQSGKYVRSGNSVTVTFDIQVSTIGTGNTSQVFGIPYLNGAVTCIGNIGYFNTLVTSVTALFARVDAGGNWVQFTGLAAASTGTPGSLAIFGGGARVIGSVTYLLDEPV